MEDFHRTFKTSRREPPKNHLKKEPSVAPASDPKWPQLVDDAGFDSWLDSVEKQLNNE